MSLSVAILLSLTKVYKKIEITQSLPNCLGGLNFTLNTFIAAFSVFTLIMSKFRQAWSMST